MPRGLPRGSLLYRPHLRFQGFCGSSARISNWTGFDECVGHARRYEPAALLARIEGNGLTLEKSAAFGMAPRSPRLLKFGMDSLVKHRTVAMCLYNWVFMPLGRLFQKRLKWGPGMIDTNGVDGILLVCRRRRHTPPGLPVQA